MFIAAQWRPDLPCLKNITPMLTGSFVQFLGPLLSVPTKADESFHHHSVHLLQLTT